MKKANNILLLLGICLYMVNVCLECYTFLPNVEEFSEQLFLYIINSTIVSFLKGLIIVALPMILLFLNLKNKYSKVFSIVVASLSVLSVGYILLDIISDYLAISIYSTSVLSYWLLVKLNLQYNTGVLMLLSILTPDYGLIVYVSFIALIMITIGAILSIKKEQKKRLDE